MRECRFALCLAARSEEICPLKIVRELEREEQDDGEPVPVRSPLPLSIPPAGNRLVTDGQPPSEILTCDVRTEGEGSWSKTRWSKGGCVDLVL